MRTCLYASERSEAMRRIVECKGGEETVRGILFNSAQNNEASLSSNLSVMS